MKILITKTLITEHLKSQRAIFTDQGNHTLCLHVALKNKDMQMY